jgi:hypothetical protein
MSSENIMLREVRNKSHILFHLDKIPGVRNPYRQEAGEWLSGPEKGEN